MNIELINKSKMYNDLRTLKAVVERNRDEGVLFDLSNDIINTFNLMIRSNLNDHYDRLGHYKYTMSK